MIHVVSVFYKNDLKEESLKSMTIKDGRTEEG